jgi:hypothetical protein
MPVKPKSVLNDPLLDQVLRELPLRHAPATLESRVFRELERRAALPWWYRGFTSWPLAARAAFVALCCGIIGFTFLDGSWATAGARLLYGAGALAISWIHPAVAAVAWAGEFSALLVRVVPPVWLYGAIAAGTMLYAALLGLGAAAYRTLYLRSSMAGDLQ